MGIQTATEWASLGAEFISEIFFPSDHAVSAIIWIPWSFSQYTACSSLKALHILFSLSPQKAHQRLVLSYSDGLTVSTSWFIVLPTQFYSQVKYIYSKPNWILHLNKLIRFLWLSSENFYFITLYFVLAVATWTEEQILTSASDKWFNLTNKMD